MKTYVYVFIRKDLPLQQQIVQACHAAHEAGLKLPLDTEEPSSLIVLEVKDQYELEMAECDVNMNGIRTQMFWEPDWDYGNTAFATECIPNDKRHLLKGYRLWKP